MGLQLTTAAALTHPAMMLREEDIIGGEFADLVDHLYMRTISYLHYGGTLISPTRVLTATHYLYDSHLLNGYYMRLSFDDQSSGGTVIGLSNIELHPSYIPNDFEKDIAVITLSRSTFAFCPVELSCTPFPGSNSDVTFAGWGRLSTDRYLPFYLRKLTVDVLSQQTCRKPYRTASPFSSLCLGTTEGGRGLYNSDSGGPAIQGSNTVVGVT